MHSKRIRDKKKNISNIYYYKVKGLFFASKRFQRFHCYFPKSNPSTYRKVDLKKYNTHSYFTHINSLGNIYFSM